ncbi:hypothetical protein [Clostridium porci]|uniref:Uncharacterized protein n=1 Tax=Clostridium porci TaxID=2605778 RepID=A0A7X2NLJ3_9CLOT|nr:hypothetical protein [Clostridium porci]MSS36921.1 hypothetical protein [Clostridium porci]
MFKKLQELYHSANESIKKAAKKTQSALQDKNSIQKLGTIIIVLLLIAAVLGLTGFLFLSVYRFIDNHMGELAIIGISIAMFFAWIQSGREQREAKRRKVLEEKYKALMPKANAVYEKVGGFMGDILRDKSLASLINLANPSNLSNIIMENPAQRIQIKPDGTGYLLTYRANKLSITNLIPEHILTIRDVLQGAINQRITSYGINGLCPPKQNTFLHVMGEPSDCHTYVTFCLDYDEEKINDSYSAAPVFSTFNDSTYGY